jgi:chromosome segregation ATPase
MGILPPGRWVGFQVELVALVNENNHMVETVQRLKSEHTVIRQRRTRLDTQFEHVNKEIKELDIAMNAMHNDLGRINALISKNTQLQEMLANDNFVLEMDIVSRLKDLEAEAVKLEQKIDLCADEKKQVLTRPAFVYLRSACLPTERLCVYLRSACLPM